MDVLNGMDKTEMFWEKVLENIDKYAMRGFFVADLMLVAIFLRVAG